MGSIVNITDASEVLKTTYTYNPFGEFTTTYNNGTIDSPFTYAGREFSSTTGHFHNRAREYMPSIGQFTSRDPYPYDTMSPNTIQRYNYCGNSPVNFVDPWGLVNFPSTSSNVMPAPWVDPGDMGWYGESGGGICAHKLKGQAHGHKRKTDSGEYVTDWDSDGDGDIDCTLTSDGKDSNGNSVNGPLYGPVGSDNEDDQCGGFVNGKFTAGYVYKEMQDLNDATSYLFGCFAEIMHFLEIVPWSH